MPSPRWTSRAALLAAGAMTVLLSSGGFTHAAPGPEVFSWGANNSGQLGNGTTTDRWAPGPVTSLARGDTAQIAAGGTGDDNVFAVARLEDGTVRAWGHNSLGQLGDGSRSDQAVPNTVPGLTGVTDVAAGGGHALAVRQGRVLAWGDNNFGQLGNGRTGDDATIPVPVQEITSAKQVAAGCDFSLALLQDGSVWAWGRGSQGQRGHGDADLATDAVPQPVTGLPEDVAQVAAGCHHALARTVSGKVYAWGDNLYGQLGNGTSTNSGTPVQVRQLTGVRTVVAGADHNFAIRNDNTVFGWGAGGSGQFIEDDATNAPNVTRTNRNSPVPVDALTGVQELAAGRDHDLALFDHRVDAWGDNGHGQLGNGTNVPRYRPVTSVRGSFEHVAVSLGGDSSYAY
ncbi:RCC1 domain-containing protein [Streptomyces sp. NPDC059340]|uniref:RCC1 domain-containing protein n=1 Tax=Streptomyces sp. NPDC059340 TaxID=3346806 RepID=UPI0036B3C375